MTRLSLGLALVLAAGCRATNTVELNPREMPWQSAVGPKDAGEAQVHLTWSEVPGASGYEVSIALTSSMEAAETRFFENSADVYPNLIVDGEVSWFTIASLVGNELSQPSIPLPASTSVTGGSLQASAGLPATLDAQALPLWHPTIAGFHDATPAPPYVCRWSFDDSTDDVILSPCTPDTVANVTHVFPDYGYVWRVRLIVLAGDGRVASSATYVLTE